MNDKDLAVSALIGQLALLVVLLFQPVLYGWAITYLWLWYVVPLGLPALSIPHAIGLSLVARLFRPSKLSAADMQALEKTKTSYKTIWAVWEAVGIPIFLWFAGWVVLQFM